MKNFARMGFSSIEGVVEMLKYTISEKEQRNPDFSGDISVLSKVNQNNCVLERAQRYLDLCVDLDKCVLQQEQSVGKVSLPADLMAVEQGISVLCDVYACGIGAKQKDVRSDIKEELKKMSGFYFEKVADAYFSACNILLDAKDVDKDELKQIAKSCNSLKDVYLHWPMDESKSDVLAFFEKVNTYSHDFDIGNSVGFSKKAKKMNNMTDYMNFSSHQRGV